MLLPYPFAGPFDYRVPPSLAPQPGDLVLVPLNRRETVGVVWDGPADPGVPDGKLKPLSALLDAPPMRADLRRLIDWIAAYTLAAPGEVLAMALRINALRPDAPPVGWRLADPPPPEVRLTEARQRVLAALADGAAHGGADLARLAGVSAAVLRGMADAGLLLPATLPVTPAFARPDPDHPGPTLSAQQADVAALLREAVAAEAFSVTLLDGVTGSGKTEVYLEAVAECLRHERQALVLLPEIALSSQWLERFAQRFGVTPAVWHSDLPSRTRRLTWRAVASGEASVVVGARSALFLPFPALGLVVVDEEHETAFKQEEGVVYHARDMAVVRARLCEAPAMLVSATPSLETMANVEAGRYRRLHLPSRHGGAALPTVALLDLRETPPERGHFLAPPLVEAMRPRSRAASRRCCSSTAAATRRSRCAGIAATACNARTAPRGWSSTAPANCCNATIAATPSRSRRAARTAMPSTASLPSAPASSGSPKRRQRPFPTRAAWSWQATPCPARTPPPRPHGPYRRARWT